MQQFVYLGLQSLSVAVFSAVLGVSEAALDRFNGPWWREIILFAVLPIVIFGISYLRIAFVACLWPAPLLFLPGTAGPNPKPTPTLPG